MKKCPIKIITAFLLAAGTLFMPSCRDKTKTESQASSSKNTSSASVSSIIDKPDLNRTPDTIGNMRLQHLFYIPEQSSLIHYVDISSENAEAVLSLRALQGLLAREKKASVFLRKNERDDYWKLYLESEYGVIFQSATVNELFKLYESSIKKLLIYDEVKIDFLDPIMTIAAAENAVPVTDSVLEVLGDNYLKENRENYKEKWATKSEAYHDIIENHLENSNLSYIYTGGADSQFSDYAYAVKGIFFNNPTDPAVSSQFAKILSLQNKNRPSLILGSGADSSLISLASPYGYVYINTASAANTTFYASIPQSAKAYSQPVAIDKKVTSGKKYISLIFSDSKGLGAAFENLSYLWEIAGNSTIPFAIQLPPIASELASPALNWFYQNRSSHSEIISESGGFGAIDSSVFPAEFTNEWFAYEDIFLKMCGIRVESGTKLHGLKPPFTANKALIVRKKEETQTNKNVFLENPDSIVSYTPLKQEDLLAFFRGVIENKDDKTEFISLFIDIADYDNQKIWHLIQLQIESLQLEMPGKVEFLLPGDMIMTATMYHETLASSISSSSEAGSSS